jgi:hypothetical protein
MMAVMSEEVMITVVSFFVQATGPIIQKRMTATSIAGGTRLKSFCFMANPFP